MSIEIASRSELDAAVVGDDLILDVGQSLVFDHTFQSGPVRIEVVARADANEPWPILSLTVNDAFVSSVAIRTSRSATYEIELQADEAEQLRLFVAPLDPVLPEGRLIVEHLEIHECEELHESCAGGGMFMAEAKACVPFVCDTAQDCSDHFNGVAFEGTCDEGMCVYPTCSAPSPNESTYGVRCLSARELSDPLRNPSSTDAVEVNELSDCPAITELRWIVERFRGEGSCVYWPICGPNPAELFGYEPQAGECCYEIGNLCGV